MFSTNESRKAKEGWLNSGEAHVHWWPRFLDWRVDNRNKTVTSYVQEWIAACAREPVGITASDNDGSWSEIERKIGDANRFSLRFDVDSPAAISDKLIHTLEVGGVGSLTLRNCTIKHLELKQTGLRWLRLDNCAIGTLRFHQHSVGTLEMIGCSVKSFFAPTPVEGSPFFGSVEVRKPRFSTAFENAQAYRNLRHHLTVLHNHEAASTFHAAEMETEAGRHSVVDRAISFSYRWLSNYGGSSARPLAIFAILVLANFLFLYCTDGVTLLGEPTEADGWHFSLYGLDEAARRLRAAAFAVSQAFNPLGIFGTRLLLFAKTPAIALVSALLGLASTTAFALFVLAVRRRFRLDKGA